MVVNVVGGMFGGYDLPHETHARRIGGGRMKHWVLAVLSFTVAILNLTVKNYAVSAVMLLLCFQRVEMAQKKKPTTDGRV